jgi:hypothetical protein
VDADEIRNIETLKRDVAARVKDANRLTLASEHTPSPKPFRAPPGPMPTLGQIARQGGGWVWLICPSQVCQHRVAAHLAIFVQQFGSEFPMDQFRARLWCTMCGLIVPPMSQVGREMMQPLMRSRKIVGITRIWRSWTANARLRM